MSSESPVPEQAPHRPFSLEQILTGVVMGLIVLITLGNVAVRYLTAQSFAATEEFSIALLLVLSFFGSITAFITDRHIRVTFAIDRLAAHWRRRAEWLSVFVTIALFAFIAWYAARLTWDQYRFEETSPALGVPQWWYTVWMPVLSVWLCVRMLGRLLRRRS